MRKPTEILTGITDQWMFDNGYLRASIDGQGASFINIVTSTDKFKALFETAMRKLGVKNKIITEELLLEIINEESAERTPYKSYKKKPRPEGYLTYKEKIELRRQRQKNGDK